jgi:hypothetical protein
MPGGVYRVGLPRSDLHVSVGDVVLKAGFALGSYVAFTPRSSGAVAVGDLALLETEVPAVTAKLQEQGLQETAIHNHVLDETPRVLFLHFRGDGDPVRLAGELRQVLSVTATPLGAAAGAPSADVGLDTAAIDQSLDHQGKANGGVYQISVARREQVHLDDLPLAPATGVTTVINFEAVPDGKAAITGDFALLPSEVPAVLHALPQAGIAITALHSHMLTDNPHLLYCHFFALGDAAGLAGALRTALAVTNSA